MKTTIIRTLLLALIGMLPLTSCEDIFDGEGDCSVSYRMRFIYDRNMSFANAFAHEVEAVSLFVFSEEGLFVQRIDQSGEALKQPDYTMELPLKAGRYTFVAWCGIEGKHQSFTVPELIPGVSSLQELTCRLQRQRAAQGYATVGEMDDLYHGMVTLDLPDTYGQVVHDMHLTKDTNHLRIVLQQTSGQPLQKDDFRITLTEANGTMNYDNSLMADEFLEFVPWDISQGTAETAPAARFEAPASRANGLNVIVAEMTTARLMKRAYQTGDRKYPILTVSKAHPETDGTYKTVLSIPLVDYALLVKGKYNEQMEDQEYLDRQDEYSLTFFLDEQQNWLSSSIIINSWKVVLSDVEL